MRQEKALAEEYSLRIFRDIRVRKTFVGARIVCNRSSHASPVFVVIVMATDNEHTHLSIAYTQRYHLHHRTIVGNQ